MDSAVTHLGTPSEPVAMDTGRLLSGIAKFDQKTVTIQTSSSTHFELYFLYLNDVVIPDKSVVVNGAFRMCTR